MADTDNDKREVEIKTYDDTYDPQKALANFQQMVADDVFAATSGLGTPTNRAWREAAIDEHGHGLGRELFAGLRRNVTSAEEGACTWL